MAGHHVHRSPAGHRKHGAGRQKAENVPCESSAHSSGSWPLPGGHITESQTVAPFTEKTSESHHPIPQVSRQEPLRLDSLTRACPASLASYGVFTEQTSKATSHIDVPFRMQAHFPLLGPRKDGSFVVMPHVVSPNKMPKLRPSRRPYSTASCPFLPPKGVSALEVD